MAIAFDNKRWKAIHENSLKWWAGELDRPLLPIELVGKDLCRPKPNVPLLDQSNCTDFSISPEEIIDRVDYELSTKEYLGDAFPFFNLMCFGPGVVAAFLGARLDNSTGSVWFHPTKDVPINELHFEYDPENIWLRRIKDICSAGAERWQGQVLIGMTDLGGILDVLATFRPGEKLLMDLFDNPEQVERLTKEIHQAWHLFFDDINAILRPTNHGCTDWSGIYYPKPGYILQCDFSYMISPDMFRQFALAEINDSCEKLVYSCYHLDGKGQLPHLDTLLSIDSLDLIQWVPGAGEPDSANWPDVFNKIYASGKKIQVAETDMKVFDAVVKQLGSAKGLQMFRSVYPITKRESVCEFLEKYNVQAFAVQ